jgi:hypothetical protein
MEVVMQKFSRFFYIFLAFFMLSAQPTLCIDPWLEKARDSAVWAGLLTVAGLSAQIIYHEYSLRRDKEERDRSYTLQKEGLVLLNKQIPIDAAKTQQQWSAIHLNTYNTMKKDHDGYCNASDPISRMLCEQFTPDLLRAYRQLIPHDEEAYSATDEDIQRQ